MGFDLNPDGVYRVKYGPAMRIVLDMADVEGSKVCCQQDNREM